MGTRFVVGRAGSGRTRRCFDAIVAAMRADPLGEPIFWLLPKQATFTAERELTVASGLNGSCRTQVLSFEELGSRVLSDCGGAAVPQVTDLGRQMVLGHLLRKHETQLRYFKSVARQAGLASELDATFAELERCGKTAADLAALVADLESTASDDHQDQALLAKLHDLRLLYDSYAAYLGQERLDPHRRLTQVLECVEGWPQMRGATVYVDGFLEFNDYERRVIASMAKTCRALEITLLLDPSSALLTNPHAMPDEMCPFHRTEDAYRRLWFTLHEEGIEVDAPVVLKEVRRFASPGLAHVEKHLLARRAPEATCENVALVEAPDRRAEVDAAARQVRDWARAGLRYRDVAILTRDLGDYHELIDASFREHDIPYFVDRRRTAAHHPLLQFTRAAFLVALGGWPHDAVVSILKSGLSGLKLDDADAVENYVLLHRVRGPAWARPEPWNFRRVVTRAGREDEIGPVETIETERIDALRRQVVDPMRPFVEKLSGARSIPIRDVVVELFDLYERFGVRAVLIGWMKTALAEGELELHDEHAQVWAKLVELFDQMVDLLGDERVSPAEALDVLEFGLERFDLALTPPTVDQVLVGSVERTRSPRPRAVVLLGMNDGQFPRVSRENSILSDGERRALRRRRIELEADSQRRLFDEDLLAYVGFTRASERLTLTRALADDESRPQAPSPYWTRVRELFPALRPHTIARRADCDADCIGTPRQLVTRLMRWARQENLQAGAQRSAAPDPTTTDVPWPSLYHWLATHPCREADDDSIDVMRFRAWKALSYANDASLSRDVSRRLFGSPLRASVSRIETFATCPFRHFVRHGLDLRPREADEVTALDLGNVYHEVLEKIVRQMIAQQHNWTDVPPDQADKLIKEYARQVGETLRGELMLSSARNKYLLQRVEKTLAQVIASHEASARRSGFRPLKAEVGFGLADSKLKAFRIDTPNGNAVELSGRIDRVDVIEDQAAFAVIDYKLRGSSLELQRVYHGLSLQLLTYLLVLQSAGGSIRGKPLAPVAAFYVKLIRQLEKCNHPDDARAPDDPLFDLQEQPRGIFDARYVELLDAQLKPTDSSNVIKAYMKKDGSLGRKSTTDFAEPAEFAGLLSLVRRKLGELADQIMDGEIDVRPYRLRQLSPCPQCEFRSVCRFDVAINQYHPLESLTREQVLAKASEEGAAR